MTFFGSVRVSPGVAIIVLLYAVAIGGWFISEPDLEISTTSHVFRSLAKISAVAAMVSFPLSPLLSVKMAWTDRLFQGLDKSINVHRNIGMAALGFGISHPLFLTLYALSSDTTSVGSVWSPTRLVVLLGLIGLIGSAVVIAMTRVRRMKHQTWMRIHRFLGWFLAVIIAHLYVSRGDVFSSRWLMFYLLLLSLAGFGAFLYQAVFNKWLVSRYPYEIVEINPVNELVTELVMKPLGPKLHYVPGQYAFVKIDSPAVDDEAHPFSFATNDNGPYIRFGIKSLGDYTSRLRNIEPGAKAYLQGPFGSFNYASVKAETQIWIAGGVGITPFLSMARSLHADFKGKIILLYGFNDLGDAVFLKELQDIAKLRPEIFEVYIASADINGYVDIDKIKAVAKDYQSAAYLVCGPTPMMKSVRAALKTNGVSENQIKTEEFNY